MGMESTQIAANTLAVIQRSNPKPTTNNNQLANSNDIQQQTIQRRKVRCKKCDACNNMDCGLCSPCRDKPKFGGNGRGNQVCETRKCLNMIDPNSSVSSSSSNSSATNSEGEEGFEVMKEQMVVPRLAYQKSGGSDDENRKPLRKRNFTVDDSSFDIEPVRPVVSANNSEGREF